MVHAFGCHQGPPWIPAMYKLGLHCTTSQLEECKVLKKRLGLKDFFRRWSNWDSEFLQNYGVLCLNERATSSASQSPPLDFNDGIHMLSFLADLFQSQRYLFNEYEKCGQNLMKSFTKQSVSWKKKRRRPAKMEPQYSKPPNTNAWMNYRPQLLKLGSEQWPSAASIDRTSSGTPDLYEERSWAQRARQRQSGEFSKESMWSSLVSRCQTRWIECFGRWGGPWTPR